MKTAPARRTGPSPPRRKVRLPNELRNYCTLMSQRLGADHGKLRRLAGHRARMSRQTSRPRRSQLGRHPRGRCRRLLAGSRRELGDGHGGCRGCSFWLASPGRDPGRRRARVDSGWTRNSPSTLPSERTAQRSAERSRARLCPPEGAGHCWMLTHPEAMAALREELWATADRHP